MSPLCHKINKPSRREGELKSCEIVNKYSYLLELNCFSNKMSFQLPADCLNEIFEYLEQDKVTLHSCLLVNRLFCEISVRILWRDIWDFKYVSLQVISTLIACLPDESRDLLYKNRIFIADQTYKSSLFNYATFIKVLSIHGLDQMIHRVLITENTSKSLSYNKNKNL